MAVDWDQNVLAPLEEEFGEAATYIPAVGSSYGITGVFDSAYKDVGLIDIDIDANTVQPVLGVRTNLFQATPVQGDQVRVPSIGKLYLVRDQRPDGHGWTKLMLADTGQP